MGIIQWYRLNIEEVWKGLALTILVLVLGFVFTTWFRTWHSFEEEMAERVSVANHYVYDFLARSQRQVASLSTHPVVVSMEHQPIQQLLDNMLVLGTDIVALVVYDATGNYVAGSTDAGPLSLRVQRDLRTPGTRILVETRGTMAPSGMAIYAPIITPDGWPAGVVKGYLSHNALMAGLDLVKQIGVPSVAFYDGVNMLLIDQGELDIADLGLLQYSPAFAKPMPGGQVQRITITADIGTYLYFFQSLPGSDSYVGTLVPREMFWQLLFKNTLAESINIILISVLFAVIAWQTGRNIRLRFLNENIIRFQAMESMTTMGQMAAGMVHEVKNPLTVIDGYLQLWDSYPEKYTSEKTLNTVRGELDRIMLVLNEYLALSRANGSNIGNIKINELLRSVITLMEVYTYRKGITIHTQFTNLPDLVGDPDKLRQVFVNLIKNAIEAFEHEGGNILVATQRDNEGKVVVIISDDGPGMLPQDVEKLGHPFFTTKASGTGLGIPVSFRIVQEHGGRVTVESKLEKGTTFRVVLPVS